MSKKHHINSAGCNSDDLEYAAVHRDEHFNVSLYKAILFCKIAAAIKCGQISLVRSYRYLSIDAYLILEQYWKAHKTHLLEAWISPVC